MSIELRSDSKDGSFYCVSIIRIIMTNKQDLRDIILKFVTFHFFNKYTGSRPYYINLNINVRYCFHNFLSCTDYLKPVGQLYGKMTELSAFYLENKLILKQLRQGETKHIILMTKIQIKMRILTSGQFLSQIKTQEDEEKKEEKGHFWRIFITSDFLLGIYVGF